MLCTDSSWRAIDGIECLASQTCFDVPCVLGMRNNAKKTNLLVLALAFLFPNDIGDPGGRRKDERYEDEQDDKERVEAFGDISLVGGLW